MKSREDVALKKNDRMTTLPQRDGSGSASRTAAGDSEIKVIACFGRCHRIANATISRNGKKASRRVALFNQPDFSARRLSPHLMQNPRLELNSIRRGLGGIIFCD